MFRISTSSLGRWSPRDFMRGRSKKGGAIHIRHTHGSKGRFDRLSSKYGIRDGRRHAGNHMQGGLGIKLGGGLFGLRIPRQHMLSTMTKEELDLEMHGHPNITNPYRERIEMHPDLKAVMDNANTQVNLIVVLPRVRRGKENALPSAWRRVLTEVDQSLQRNIASLGKATVCFSTLQSQAICVVGENWVKDATVTLTELYRDHSVKGHVLSNPGKKKIRLFGHLMKANTVSASEHYVSSALQGLSSPKKKDPTTPIRGETMSSNIQRATLEDYILQLRTTYPNALCLCSRPSSIVRPVDGAADGGERLPRRGPTVSSAPSKARRILKSDIPLDETGVWKLKKSAASKLLRWHYASNDPRAHNSDAIPHAQRNFTILFLADLSTAPQEKQVSLLSHQQNDLLRELSFLPVASDCVEEVLETCGLWTVERSWGTMLEQKRLRSRSNQVHA